MKTEEVVMAMNKNNEQIAQRIVELDALFTHLNTRVTNLESQIVSLRLELGKY